MSEARKRELTWLPFGAGAAVAAVIVVVVLTLGSASAPPPGGAATARAAVATFVHARATGHPTHCRAGSGGGADAGWTSRDESVKGAPVRVRIAPDGRHATVYLPRRRQYRLRIDRVGGRYYACTPA